MNAFELYDAVYDSARSEYAPEADDREGQIQDVIDYASGAFDLYVSRDTAEKIVDSHFACRAANDADEHGVQITHNRYTCIEQPLSVIELGQLEIIYGAATHNMGETTEREAECYREWAEEQIAARYPDACITVSEKDEPTRVYGAANYEQEVAALEFCAELWDRCPWPEEWLAEERAFNAAGEKFGFVDFDGKKYALLCQAELTCALFPGCWSEAQAGDEYAAQWAAPAVDINGNEFKVVWEWQETKGEELEDASGYDWDDNIANVTSA
jgi:hypothetical protein